MLTAYTIPFPDKQRHHEQDDQLWLAMFCAVMTRRGKSQYRQSIVIACK
jgi:hypothetical protein